MIRFLSNNPFRILGVCSNAPIREITANKTKMDAFAKVGKEVSFPLDFAALLGGLERTPESIAAADSQLTIEGDRLLAAQFWFIRLSPIDDDAFGKLAAGDIDAAIEVWSRDEELSSLQNSAICHLTKGDIGSACRCLATLYDRYRNEFATAIGINHDITLEQLVNGLIASIVEEKPDADLSQLTNPEFTDEWNKLARSRIAEPLIKRLSDAIRATKISRENNNLKGLAAGKNLIKASTLIMVELKRLLPANDPKLAEISDDLVSELIECEEAYRQDLGSLSDLYDSYEYVEAIQWFAMSTAAAETTKNIVKKNVGTLPPPEAEQEHAKLVETFDDYYAKIHDIDDIETLINNIERPLEAVKNKVGETNGYYVDVSSLVVNLIMYELIVKFNVTVKTETNRNTIYKMLREEEIRDDIEYAIKTTWHLYGRIEKFAMNDDTRKPFDEKKEDFRRNLIEPLEKAEKNKIPQSIKIIIGILIIILIRLICAWLGG